VAGPINPDELAVFDVKEIPFVLKRQRNSRPFTHNDIAEFAVGRVTDSAKLDLLVALCVLKYTQSNSIV
jgi:AICAR transformylase/IMP cyclohydrolase PurH